MRPLQILAHFVKRVVPERLLAREEADPSAVTGSRTVWQAIYSFKNGDKPRHIPSAAVAGPRFMQSQLKGPSESNKRRLREYGYITEAENRATCVSNHVVCTGYSSEEWGKSG